MTRSNVYNLFYGLIAIVAALVVAVRLLRLPGCLGEATGTVTGKVNFMGKPLPEGWITFFDRAGNGYRAFIHPDGSYTLSNIPQGSVRIAVDSKGNPERVLRDLLGNHSGHMCTSRGTIGNRISRVCH
jgi:hypothetical protein